MIKIKLNDLVLAETALLKLFFQNSEEDMEKWEPQKGPNVGATLRIGKLAQPCLAEIEKFYLARIELWKKYGTPEEDNKSYTIPKENLEEYVKEEADLLSTEVELVNAFKLKLADIENINLNWRDLQLLEKHFVDLSEL